MPVLIAENAIVRTATVAMKTMHIGNKQVTLAVFRHIKPENIVDEETGQLKGVPWGTVNSFWGDCVEGTHLHVVWQKGADLRRCCLRPGQVLYGKKSEQLQEAYTQCQAAAQAQLNTSLLTATHWLIAKILLEPSSAAPHIHEWEKAKQVHINIGHEGRSRSLTFPSPSMGSLSTLAHAFRYAKVQDNYACSRAYEGLYDATHTPTVGEKPSCDAVRLPPLDANNPNGIAALHEHNERRRQEFWKRLVAYWHEQRTATLALLDSLSRDVQTTGADYDVLREEAAAQQRAWEQWNEKLQSAYRQHYAAIAQLDQLFIAV